MTPTSAFVSVFLLHNGTIAQITPRINRSILLTWASSGAITLYHQRLLMATNYDESIEMTLYTSSMTEIAAVYPLHDLDRLRRRRDLHRVYLGTGNGAR